MTREKRRSIIESILFAMGEPVSLHELSQSMNVAEGEIRPILEELVESYQKRNSGIRIIRLNTKYQMCTNPDNYEFIHELLYEKNKGTLSQAALETLAIIAYKQPVTRMEIESLRGVKSSSSIQTLADRNLIREAGKLDAPGKPNLYETTTEFLKYANIASLKDLPSYHEFVEGVQEKIDG
ncbi:SMC-Scp complex subunit ScpB [Alkalibacter rhizosphaerae]|uniref:Segregation and condensation protein B n=1 Tax=Alkalibacter rhizosphaerae TaxID=2815577 RepID=A0A974XFH9_9FIRM|nr:SMC-Scp complex subunit ScpB [Alkalibacter rhizosphaerae]QSX08907.1 SMC-Scp complex subunit ScpB [Alkalibacter rhizosphaerae]